ncbi:MAG TPA: efflux RND transporter periplasmic adaptor subunit [Pyrinomonadaceae bacterium]|nr:efflux RND transporter periplasmic adaptor subunit [Acidobacteriota bacterium]HQZ96283.1 efflux RND transporter periplasmic adaptor subunit [Pyrinomonadaceae bacterium]
MEKAQKPYGSTAGSKDEEVEANIYAGETSQSKSGNRSENVQKWLIRSGVLAVIVLLVVAVVWLMRRPKSVDLVEPKPATITETISGSGTVGGETESNVGAQLQGIVQKLYVKEGDSIVRGQQLALIKNDVAEAQIWQARSAVVTARAQLAQVSRDALGSDINAAVEQVNQAIAQVEQQRSVIAQTEKSVNQGSSVLEQLLSEKDLAVKELGRSSSLVKSGDISRSEYDRDLNILKVAEKRVEAQKQAIEVSRANVRSAQSGLKSLEANVRVLQSRLRTIQGGARDEDIRVAQSRVAETERALSVAEEQAGNASVTAPFAGTVTKINAETGQSVGSLGVLTLVSVEPEIRIDVDESNLSVLKVGQEAVISSDPFSENAFSGRVSELGAAVDQVRGTITIKVIPDNPPDWLRLGQTINVNIITAKSVSRLLIPQTAPVRVGDETVVFIIVDGKAAQKPVVTRLPTKDGVPVISGLEAEDRIIAAPTNIKVGDRVQPR